jgi:NAD-dependent DNA ligase
VARRQFLIRSGSRHSALEDAYLCARIYLSQQGLYESFPLSVFPNLEPTNYRGPPRPLPPPLHPLAHKRVAFAGHLTAIDRAVAKRHLVKLGAHVTTTLNHDTDFLVVGKGNSSKVIRAEQMIAEGRGLRILKEDAFILMLEDDWI